MIPQNQIQNSIEIRHVVSDGQTNRIVHTELILCASYKDVIQVNLIKILRDVHV